MYASTSAPFSCKSPAKTGRAAVIACAICSARFVHLFKLGQRQHVPVRILKPGNECAAGRMPYIIGVLDQAFVTLKNHSARPQKLHRPANIRNCPPQCRVRGVVDAINLLNAQHRVADLKHQCRRLIRDKSQLERSLIKRSCPLDIRRCQEQDRLIERCHFPAESPGSATATRASLRRQ